MKRPFRFLAVVVPALFLGACDDPSTRPETQSSTVTVRAYVDANGSGTFDAGDVPISGDAVTLTASTGAVLTATTDNAGLATFEDVPAGSYQVEFGGDAPFGAVLATASRPVLAAPAFGADLATEFRFVFNPGDITGVLYRDENENAQFDTLDTPAPGIPVAVYAGGDTSGDPVAETTTDAQGAFSFQGLRPGTYTLSFTPFPTMQLVGGNTQTVTVGAAAESVAEVAFTGSLLSTIAEARAAAVAGNQEGGEQIVVAVEGVVAWQPPFSDELFIQDETAGIQVYARDVGVRDLGLERGDTVIVVGRTDVRFGEVQLTSVSTLLVGGRGPAPEPLATSATDINAGENQHEVVQVTGARVNNVEVLRFGNQFVTLEDQAGNEFGVYVDSRTGVESDTWTVGGIYDVSGVLGFDSRYAFHHRIEVRGPEDVVPGEAPMTIAEARSAPAGEEVTVVGVVTWQPSGFSDELFIQDETAGIQVYARDSNVRSLELQPGDIVLLTGTTQDRFGERQITSTTSLARIGQQDAPTPVLVTPAEVASGDLEHQLVRVDSATVTAVEEISFGNQLVTLEAPNGVEFGVYVDSRIGVTASHWTVGQVYDITGVINYDSRYGPFVHRIWIRSAADGQARS